MWRDEVPLFDNVPDLGGEKRDNPSNTRNRFPSDAVEIANGTLEQDGHEPITHVTRHSLRRTFASMEVPRSRNPRRSRAFGKRLMGFEPTTFCMASRRSSQLSYSRNGGRV